MKKEERIDYNRRYRIKNKERLKILEKKRRSDPKRRKKIQEYQREWYRRNPGYFKRKIEQNREHYILYKRGWSLRKREKDAGVKRSDQCEICGSEEKIVYDHNHNTGEFRGWICGRCNCALGYARDDIKILRLMIKYLKKNGSEKSQNSPRFAHQQTDQS